jgi:hypothetical protein
MDYLPEALKLIALSSKTVTLRDRKETPGRTR